MKIYRLNVNFDKNRLYLSSHDFDLNVHKISTGSLTVSSISYRIGKLNVLLTTLNSVTEDTIFCFPKNGIFYSFNRSDIERMVDFLKKHHKNIRLVRNGFSWISDKYFLEHKTIGK